VVTKFRFRVWKKYNFYPLSRKKSSSSLLSGSDSFCLHPTPIAWRAVCTRLRDLFTVTWWFTITSNSSFIFSSCREQSELRRILEICSSSQICFFLSTPL